MPSFETLTRAGAGALAFCLSVALAAVPASGQSSQGASAPKLWQGSAVANASVFFGNTQQQVYGIDAKLARVDSSFGVSAELQTLYGEASLNGAAKAVTKRLWMATMTGNLRPLARVSGFVTGTFESNLEKRIDSRYSLGAGAKWNVRQTAATQADLSVALSAERTTPRDSTVKLPVERIARVSILAKFQHSFDDRVQLAQSASWQPSASGPSQYLLNSNTVLRYKMNGILSLSLAFTDNYDSGAMSRGAKTNNDGQLLFGVSAGW